MAQQLPNASYYMYDYARTNPGSLGSKDMVCASGIWKNQMQGFDGAPVSTLINTEIPFNLFGAKHGAGISLIQDQYGYYSNFELRIGYAFRFKVADGTLGIGINGDIRQNGLDDPEWIVGANGDEDDPNIPQGSEDNYNGFGAGFGLFYRSEDIYIGASVSNIYSSEIEYTSESSTSSATEIIRPHYYIMAGYNYQLANPAYEITPSVMFYSDGTKTTFDLNGTLTYNKKVWGGVSYRAGSAVVGMVGLIIFDGVKVGYAYDYSTSALSKYSSGGHEILLNYCFKLGVEKSPERYRSIRYL